MEVSKKFNEVRDVVVEIFETAGMGDALDKEGAVFNICNDIRNSKEDLAEYYSENSDDCEKFQTRLLAFEESDVIEIQDLWKALVVLSTLNSLDLGGGRKISEKLTSKFGNREEMTDFLKNILNDDGVSTSEKVDKALGVYVCAIEKALNDEDEDEIKAWTWGFGNCASDNYFDISEIIEGIDYEVKEILLEDFMLLIKARFGMDTFEEGEYRSEEEGVLWESVIEEIISSEM